MHGHTIAHGDSIDGISTTAGSMTLGITAVFTILGIMVAPGASMILGTMEDITVAFTAAGMVIHGDRTILVSTTDTIITQDTSRHRLEALQTRTTSAASVIRPALRDLPQAAAVVRSEEAQA